MIYFFNDREIKDVIIAFRCFETQHYDCKIYAI